MKDFPPFRLDPVNQCLWRCSDGGADERILLKPKAFAILLYLANRAGRLVTQNELLEAVWPNTYVEPEVLKRHIFNLRAELGDDAKNPLFIETLPRRGYQFIAAMGDSPARGATAATMPGQTKLVGRDRAIGELRGHLGIAAGGKRQIVFVTGEPGIGKTSVVDELQRQALEWRMGPHGFVRIARGQCVEGFGGKEPYYPMLQALGDLCRGATGDTVVQVLGAQAPTWLVQFPSLIKSQQRETLQREILGATRERMLREIAAALEAITAEIPLLLVLEDLHWVDQSTVDLISSLARGREPARLLIAGTFRPVEMTLSDHPLNGVKQDLLVHRLCHELALQPLGETEIAAWLAGESPESQLPRGFAALLHRHSEGNPLFMVTALEHMTQRGLVIHEKGRWTLNVALDAIDIQAPESLRAMIETQIERLTGEEQRALEVASVAGVWFTTNLTGAAATLEEEKFEDVCEALSRRRWIVRQAGLHQFPDGSVSQRYEFVHALYREVLYRGQPPGRRSKVHLRIGERLEKLYSQHEDEIAAVLAEHFEEALALPRAVKYLRLAADSARRRYAHREAIAILKHAADLVDRLPEKDRAIPEMEVLEQLGMFHSALYDARAAIESYERLIALADRHGLVDVQIRALLDMLLPAAFTSTQLFLETLDRALELSCRQEDPYLRARTRFSCLSLRATAGRWRTDDAEACLKALEEVESRGDIFATAEHRLEYTRIQLASSRYRDAHRNGFESLAVLLRQDDFNPYLGLLYVKNHWLLLRNLVVWGEWGQALKEVGAEIRLCEQNGDYARGQQILLHAGYIRLFAKDFSGVLALCEAIFASVATPSGLRSLNILIGSAEAGSGNHDRAIEHLMKVKDEMDRDPMMDDWYQRLSLEAGLVEVWLSKRDLAGARREAACFLDISLATAERTFQGLAWEANARVAIAANEWKRAEDFIAKGLLTIEGYEVPLAAWQVHGTAAELWARAGQKDLSEQHTELSRATILKLANSLESEDPLLRATFLSAPAVRKLLDFRTLSVPADRSGTDS